VSGEPRPRVLVVDDKDSLRELVARILAPRFEVVTARDGAEAIARLAAEDVDVVLSDMRMPGADGLEVLRVAKERRPDVEVVLMTAFASVQSAVEAIRAGAFDYLPKPFDPDEALLKVERAAERRALKVRARGLEAALGEATRVGELLGQSAPMKQVFALIDKAAQRDLTVLLQGESGTGKELAARAIHQASARREQAFVAVNCGALPHDLVESELMGHARGAFSGALRDKPGLLEEAGRGTVFLDEIGDLPLALQVKLNRVLQERELRRVGENAARPFLARVIAASHRDLAAEVARGAFREDLYFRLAVFRLRIPPLRERSDDIPLLARHFLARARVEAGAGPTSFRPEVMAALVAWGFPGNVRELDNAVRRAAAVADGPAVELEDLPPEILGHEGAEGADAGADDDLDAWLELPYREAMAEADRRAHARWLDRLFAAHAGNVSQAAARAGIARETLHRLARRFQVDPDAFRRSRG